jgi:aminoglycoside phosphotransferase (APT) family kinase protein
MMDNIKEQLLLYYQERVSTKKNPIIDDFTHISDGWENEVYAFTLKHGDGHEDLILRIYPGDNAQEKSLREFNGMQNLYKQGYPVPEVFIHERGTSWFGNPFVVMQKIDGRQMGKSSSGREKKFLTRFCQLFFDLHALDFQSYLTPIFDGQDLDDPLLFINLTLKEWRGYLDMVNHHEFDPVIGWLEAHAKDTPCKRLSPIHGDFHDLNILVTPSDNAFVIDWTGISVGDYRYDLAWTLLLHGLYGGVEQREEILAEYQRIAGHTVENPEYFDVMAVCRRLASIVISISDGAEKMGMRPETVEIMKQEVGHIKTMYSMLQDRTGLTLPEVERTIKSLE